MFNIRKFFEGIGIVPKTTTTADTQGELEVLSSDGKLRYHNGTSVSPVVTESHAGTLTNKTIDADLNTITNIDNTDIKAGAAIDAAKIADGSVSNTEFQYLDGVTSNIQNQLDSKSPSGNYITDLTGDVTATGPGSAVATLSNGVVTDSKVAAVANIARTKLASGNNFRILANNGTGVMSENPAITPSRAVTSDANGQLAASTTTAVELDYVNGVTSSIQTQLDSKASDASLTAHTGASSSVHGVTGSVVGTTDSQTLTNKTLTSPIVDTVVWDDQASTPANPSSGFYKTYFKTDGNLYKLNSLGVEEQVGSGVGGINLITLDSNYLATQKANFDFETTIGTWVAYADAAAVIPVDMTGGTPGTTVTRTTSSPLDGAASGLMDLKTGSSRQGEGMSNLVYIAPGYRGQQVQFIFPYTVTGTYTAQDLRIFAYDVTNSVLLYPSLNNGINAGTDVASATFQLAPNTAQVRFGVHIARTATSSLSMKFDDVQVVPVKISAPALLSMITNPVSYTPSIVGLTPSNVNFQYWREGSVLHVSGRFSVTAGTGATFQISLPASLTITSDITDVRNIGEWAIDAAATASLPVLAVGNNAFVTFGQQNGANAGLVSIAGTGVTGSGASNVAVKFSVPVNQWTQSVTGNIFESGDYGWTEYIPSFTSFGTTTNVRFFHKRVGDSILISGEFDSGTVVASEARISLPPNLLIDAQKNPGLKNYGDLILNQTSTEAIKVAAEPGVNYIVFTRISGSGSQLTKINGNNLYSNVRNTLITGPIPIQGWSTFPFGVALAPPRNEYYTYGILGVGSTNDSVMRFQTVGSTVINATDIVHATSGTLGDTFTIAQPGIYSIFGQVYNDAIGRVAVTRNSTNLNVSIDSVPESQILIQGCRSASVNAHSTFSGTVNLNAGDVLRVQNTKTSLNTGNTSSVGYIRITQVGK